MANSGQCHARGYGNKKCQQGSIKGKKYCTAHLHLDRDTKDNPFGINFRDDQQRFNAFDKTKMAFFRKHIGPKLTELMDDALLVKEFDISEEVALVRVSQIELAKVFSNLVEIANDPSLAPKTPEAIELHNLLLSQTATLIRSGMEEITRLVERQAKIHSLVAEKMHPNAIGEVVKQINLIIYDTLGAEHWDLVEAISKKLDTELEIPSLKNLGYSNGATITPNEEVSLMDASVPLYVEPEQVIEAELVT